MSELNGPEQVIFVTSTAEISLFGKKVLKEDIDTIFWHMPVSKQELLYAISVHKNKNMYNLIKESGLFIVNFIPFNLEKEVKECNLIDGTHIDKFKKLNLTKKQGDHIDCVYIKEACAHLECQVIQTLEFKDYVVFIAKIIYSSKKYDVKRLFHLKKEIYTTTKENYEV
jgi:flavin reductase (DIM6/NTAB) family NADH-FMN oxidoreductase RutF